MQSAARVRSPWRHWDDQALRRGVGVYIHVPFCLGRCRYCDFLSFGGEHPPGFGPREYAPLLQDEIARRGAWARAHYGALGREADTLFIGGGTPTRLGAEQLGGIVRAAREEFALAKYAEVTVEANPETLTRELLAALWEAGVNRLSVGIQAAQDRHLRFLGRTHRAAVIARALDLIALGPPFHLSFDLIYAVPGLTPRELRQTLRLLLSLNPGHLSAYELTLEAGTPLCALAQSHPRLVVPSERAVSQQRVVERTLAGHGLYRYEVSNYARPGAECRHNLRYWRGGDYAGLGLGAASRIGSEVLNNPHTPEEYKAHVALAGGPSDPLVQAAGRSLKAGAGAVAAGRIAPPADTFLQLRTRAGLTLASTGGRRDIDRRWIERGWLRARAGGFEVTNRGLDYADMLARELG